MAPAASPLGPHTDNVPPPLTPGKKVVALTAALEKKGAENDALRGRVDELADALAGLAVVQDKVDADGAAAGAAPADQKEGKKGKKDKDAPVPAKTAYKFYCDAHPKTAAGGAMRQVWKEASPEIRQSYETMAAADKTRHAREAASYNEEKTALAMYYDQKKQDAAMEFYEAHLAAQAALEKAGAETKKGKKKAKAKAKDPEAPKRPTSSYMYFAADKRESVAKKNPAAAPKDIMKTLGELWGQLEKGTAGKKGTKQYDDLAAEDRVRYEGEKKAYDAVVAERNKQAEQQKAERRNKDKEEALELLKSRQEAALVFAPATFQPAAANTVALDDMSVVSPLSTAPKPKKKKDPNAPKKARSAYIYFTMENRGKIQAQMKEGSSQPEILTEVGRQWREIAAGEKEKYQTMADKDKERSAKEMEKYNASKK